ncbi:hypothetical protein SASPL_139699 [Salvia splendens]|uniref:Uncharacterized protein n=1 Tax=Salvia splendens TaxID=180675 RepID=A0A8X8WQK2_SALSN|nr:hypothetical protein SASPL_139699 [Salvia splendens]
MAIVISVILLFLGMGVLVLIHVWIVGRTLRNDVSSERRNAVERDDIEKLPCFDFAAKAKGSSPGLEKFRDAVVQPQLPRGARGFVAAEGSRLPHLQSCCSC